MEALLVAIFVGLGTGIASNVIAWWFIATSMRPRVYVTPYLARRVAGGKRRTQMKMTNVGRRIAFDVEVRVQLRLPSLRHTGVTEIFDLMSFHIEDMPPKIPRQSTIRPISSEKLVTYFKQQRHKLPPDLVARSDNSIELADILSTFSGSRLGITVSAVDAYRQRPIVTKHFFTAESI